MAHKTITLTTELREPNKDKVLTSRKVNCRGRFAFKELQEGLGECKKVNQFMGTAKVLARRL